MPHVYKTKSGFSLKKWKNNQYLQKKKPKQTKNPKNYTKGNTLRSTLECYRCHEIALSFQCSIDFSENSVWEQACEPKPYWRELFYLLFPQNI